MNLNIKIIATAICFLSISGILLSEESPDPSSASAVVVANVKFPKDVFTKKELLSILSKKTLKIGSVSVQPFILAKGNPCLPSFYSLTGLSEKDLQIYWLKLSFSGRGVPPETLKDESEMIKKVQNKPGAVGFICQGTEAKDVKIIKIVE